MIKWAPSEVNNISWARIIVENLDEKIFLEKQSQQAQIGRKGGWELGRGR